MKCPKCGSTKIHPTYEFQCIEGIPMKCDECYFTWCFYFRKDLHDRLTILEEKVAKIEKILDKLTCGVLE